MCPGMVTGGASRGVYGTLLKLCRRTMLVPVVNGAAPLYPIHVDDLCDAILAMVQSSVRVSRVVRVAPSASMTFADYLRMLARERLGRPVMPIVLPLKFVVAANHFARRLSWLPSVPDERLMGLAALGAISHQETFLAPDMPPIRDVRAILGDEGRRRRLLLEGLTLFRYAVRSNVPLVAVRRYVGAVLLENDSQPLALPLAVHFWPWLLRLIEPLTASADPRLRRRLSIAMRIVEMTTTAAPVFHNYKSVSKARSVIRLGLLIVAERVLATPGSVRSSDRRPDRVRTKGTGPRLVL